MYPLTDYQAAYMTFMYASGYLDRMFHWSGETESEAAIASARELKMNATRAYVEARLSQHVERTR